MAGVVAPVTREAYSREVISFGFWFGDDRLPSRRSTPTPPQSHPDWLQSRCSRMPGSGSHGTVAIWPCCAMTTPAPATIPAPLTVLDFYESAYQAGARLAGWDIQRLACPGGITDPALGWHQS
jgi:hypothetical protein